MTVKTKKPKLPTFLTPPGQAVFPWLNQPDRGEYVKDKEFGVFKTGLRLLMSNPEVMKFAQQLEAAYQANLTTVEAEETPKERAVREAANKTLGATKPWKQEFDDAGNPTGYLLVTFKRSGGGRDQKDPSRTWTNVVGLFDSKNKELDRSKVRIGGGSKIVVAYCISPFATQIGAGISLQLQAVQVLERADAPTKDAAQYGFRQQEEGFVDDSGDAPMTAESVASSGDDSGNDV